MYLQTEVDTFTEFHQQPHELTSNKSHQPQTQKEFNFNQPISSQILQTPLIAAWEVAAPACLEQHNTEVPTTSSPNKTQCKVLR